MKRNARTLAALVSVLAIGLIAAVAIAGAATKSKGVKDSGTSYVSIVHQKGKVLDAAGYSFDKKFGQIASTYQTKVTAGKTGTINIVVPRVTDWTPKGSLWGTATATQNLATGAVTNGKLNLNHGTGLLKGHSFKGTFTGTFDSKTSVYTFKYKGTLK